MSLKLLLSVSSVVILSACGSMSGLDAKTQFSCKAPEGVLCESMSGIYANAMQNNLPGQQVNRGRDEVSRAKPAPEPSAGVLTRPITSGTPIRSAPLILRVWLAPWEDGDGDLHDQSYVYLPVHEGKWLIEHNRRRIADAYRPVRAPTAPVADTAAAAATAGVRVVPPPGGDSTTADTAGQAQNARELLNGLLRPGMPGTPAQPTETE